MESWISYNIYAQQTYAILITKQSKLIHITTYAQQTVLFLFFFDEKELFLTLQQLYSIREQFK